MDAIRASDDVAAPSRGRKDSQGYRPFSSTPCPQRSPVHSLNATASASNAMSPACSASATARTRRRSPHARSETRREQETGGHLELCRSPLSSPTHENAYSNSGTPASGHSLAEISANRCSARARTNDGVATRELAEGLRSSGIAGLEMVSGDTQRAPYRGRQSRACFATCSDGGSTSTSVVSHRRAIIM